MPLVSFYTPWKHEEMFSGNVFVMFSEAATGGVLYKKLFWKISQNS